jgi:thioredoxin-dependent peroxiredoxin
MEAYRDQYATLFNNGRKVVVLAVSVDPDTALASWARDASFPMLFGTDPGGVVGRRYGSYDAKNSLDDRSLYVIGPDGRIAYRAKPFRQMAANAYTELGKVVDRLSPPPAEHSP